MFLPGESLGWRRLLGYRPWGHKESDMTEHEQTQNTVDLQCFGYSANCSSYRFIFFFRFSSPISYYKVLNIGPYTLQQVLVICFIYSSVYPIFPIYLSLPKKFLSLILGNLDCITPQLPDSIFPPCRPEYPSLIYKLENQR